MERKDILAQVQDVFREELEVDDLVLTDETTADDVEEWDSLSHVQLVVALEKSFGIKFTSVKSSHGTMWETLLTASRRKSKKRTEW